MISKNFLIFLMDTSDIISLNISNSGTFFAPGPTNKVNGSSIRCLKD
jgi:hypothetical protein